MRLLLTETIPSENLFLVIPVLNGKPSPDVEFVFEDEGEQQAFIHAYMVNPHAAVFAYHVMNSFHLEVQVPTWQIGGGHDAA